MHKKFKCRSPQNPNQNLDIQFGDVFNTLLLIFSIIINYPILMMEETRRRAVKKTDMEMFSFKVFLPIVMIPCPACPPLPLVWRFRLPTISQVTV